jgi:O-antigen/teichoic acid export membrane protein
MFENRGIMKREFLKNVLMVALSNVVVLFTSILIGFGLPKLMSVYDYGKYRTFTLFLSYIGLFHFGFIDGIYILYGGRRYEQLPFKRFRVYSRFLFILEMIVAGALVLFSIAFLSGSVKYIFCAVSLNLLIINITTFYQYISQITQRFRELSIRNIAKSSMLAICLLIIWMLQVNGVVETLKYYEYIIVFTVANLCVCIWYMLTYSTMIFGAAEKLVDNVGNIIELFKKGIPLLTANLVTNILFTLDKQYVLMLFDLKTYAIYAFAYSMLTIFTSIISSVSVVLYPMLKNTSKDKMIKSYSTSIAFMNMFVCACFLGYTPLVYFVKWYLPQYGESMNYFMIILPGIALSCTISVIIQNYYKTFNITKLYFKKVVIVLLVSIINNSIAYYFFGTASSISVASILTIGFWFIYTEDYFLKLYSVEVKKNRIYLMIMISAFYLSNYFLSHLNAILIYSIMYFTGTILMYKGEIREILVG